MANNEASAEERVIKGLGISPGSANARAAFSPDKAEEFRNKGIKYIYVHEGIFFNPEEEKAMNGSCGIVAIDGGNTSYVAVHARLTSKPAVAGNDKLRLKVHSKELINKENGFNMKEGDFITLNGETGELYLDAVDWENMGIIAKNEKFYKREGE